MRIALIRHLPPLIPPGICYGRLDIPMRPEHLDEVRGIAASAMLRGATRIWSSPARRCRPLAEAIAVKLGRPLTVDSRLQELDFGAWEGRSWNSIARSELDRWAEAPLDFRAPGGESGAELIARVSDVWAAFCGRGEDCVVVSHGGPLKILTALSQGGEVDLLSPAPPMGEILLAEL